MYSDSAQQKKNNRKLLFFFKNHANLYYADSTMSLQSEIINLNR